MGKLILEVPFNEGDDLEISSIFNEEDNDA